MKDATPSGERRLTEIEYIVVCHLAEARTLLLLCARVCVCVGTYDAYTAWWHRDP